MSKRIFGNKLDFKSLSCAPVNEQGVVYLFGVLHESFDFMIESIQSGFPDCIARRQINKDRWEELRIEFEFDSRSFLSHKHDPDAVDMIICWKHNWTDCPKNIEVIELSSIIHELENIHHSIESSSKKLSEYALFCRKMRLEGLSFQQIAPLWNELKQKKKIVEKKPLKLNAYQSFVRDKILNGFSLQEAAKIWKEQKKK